MPVCKIKMIPINNFYYFLVKLKLFVAFIVAVERPAIQIALSGVQQFSSQNNETKNVRSLCCVCNCIKELEFARAKHEHENVFVQTEGCLTQMKMS